jgi:hypothetical protein
MVVVNEWAFRSGTSGSLTPAHCIRKSSLAEFSLGSLALESESDYEFRNQ